MTLAIIAGMGDLPELLWAAAPDAVICEMQGFPARVPAHASLIRFRVEHLGSLLADLNARGVTQICCAGAMGRPKIDPAQIDAATMPLVPQIMAAVQAGGDDATLRAALKLFEQAGFEIKAAHDILPDLLPESGILSGEVSDQHADDAMRAGEVLGCLAAADIGQACVVHQDRVIAVEATPGTDWMLSSLADGEAWGGLLFKAAKPKQDRRVDMPTIGPDTVRLAAAAGLRAIVVAAGDVQIVQRELVIDQCRAHGITLWVR